jgi:predicted permease
VFALGLTYALSLSPTVAATLVLFAAMPTASAAHVLAAGFGADRQWPATLVAQTTLLSAVTLPLWITVIELAILR